MISMLRQGPKQIVLGSRDYMVLKNFLIKKFDAIENNSDIVDAITIADEDNTIIWITEPGKKIAHISDVRAALIVQMTSDRFFSELINLNGAHLIDDSHISPGLLMMRIVGDHEKIIESVRETYAGRIMSLKECLDQGSSSQTIMSFTKKPINQKLSVSDLEKKHVLINMESNKLNRRIRSQVLRFLNDGLKDSDWYDLQIRIYDRYSEYKLHYERLSLFLDSLEPGLILGEGWGRDYPRFLMSVLVYQIRLFTLLTPVEIKEILLGLEYLEDGTRIVDLDLMHRNKKVEWPEVIGREYKTRNRMELGKILRNKILSGLKQEDLEKLNRIEEEIVKTRY